MCVHFSSQNSFHSWLSGGFLEWRCLSKPPDPDSSPGPELEGLGRASPAHWEPSPSSQRCASFEPESGEVLPTSQAWRWPRVLSSGPGFGALKGQRRGMGLLWVLDCGPGLAGRGPRSTSAGGRLSGPDPEARAGAHTHTHTHPAGAHTGSGWFSAPWEPWRGADVLTLVLACVSGAAGPRPPVPPTSRFANTATSPP